MHHWKAPIVALQEPAAAGNLAAQPQKEIGNAKRESLAAGKEDKASMLITDLSEKESLDFLTRARLARLACAKDGQPYIVPIFCAYQNGYVYCASTEGKKIEWMRANPLVCLEVDEIDSPQHWTSLIVQGRFEEILNSLEWEVERKLAWFILQQRPIWWEPAYVETIVNRTEKVLHPLFFRIHIMHMSGRRGVVKNT